MEIKDKKYYASRRPEMISLISKSSKKILEIGCGQGNFSSQLVNENTEIWGVEPNKNSVKVAEKKLFKVLEGTLDERLNDLPDNYFDTIILNDVLEHLLYPWEDLKSLKVKLVRNGEIVSSIPNVRYAKNLFQFMFAKNWEYRQEGILDSTHFRFFTKKSIISLYNKSGYSVKKIKAINCTKSFLYFPLAVIFNVIFLFTQLDIFFMQYATVSRKTE